MCSWHVFKLNYYALRLLNDDGFHGCNGLLDLPSEKSTKVGIRANRFYAFNIIHDLSERVLDLEDKLAESRKVTKAAPAAKKETTAV